jgi:hypothetical protein
MNMNAVAMQIKQKLVGAVLNPVTWRWIQERNPNAFEYVSSGGRAQLLDIYLENSSVAYYQTTRATAGFNLQGQPCLQDQLFNSETGNDHCPFRYQVRLLSHVQQNSNWIDTLGFELLYKPENSEIILNTSKQDLSFTLVRNVQEQNLEASCLAIQGIFDPATSLCSVQLTQETSCSNSGAAYGGPGAQAQGRPCPAIQIQPVNCGVGRVIKGFDPQGNPRCGDYHEGH